MRSSKAAALALSFALGLSPPAFAGSIPLLGAGTAVGGGGGGGLVATYLTSGAVGGVFAASYTSGSFSIGTASADRILVLCAYIAGLSTTGVTAQIGASTPTAISATQATTSAWGGQWYLNVPSGTTTTIKLTGVGANIADLGYSVWSITGQSGGSGATPTASNKATNAGAEPSTLAQTVSAGGVAFNCAFADGGGTAGMTATWTNTTASGGDALAFATTGNSPTFAAAHSTATATVGVSTSSSAFSFGSKQSYSAWGP